MPIALLLLLKIPANVNENATVKTNNITKRLRVLALLLLLLLPLMPLLKYYRILCIYGVPYIEVMINIASKSKFHYSLSNI